MTTRLLIAVGITLGAFSLATIGGDTVWFGVHLGETTVTRRSANRVEWALTQPAHCNFSATPLATVCEEFEATYRISIWIDEQALADEGINIDTEVTLQVRDITLESALSLMFEPLALTYLSEDGVLKITTQTKSDEKLTIRIYPVGDLVALGTRPEDYDQLVSAIETSTSSKWYETDGEGGHISTFENARSLMIRQTQRVHREIGGMLAALREAKNVQQLPSIPARFDQPDQLAPISPARTMPLKVRESRPVSAWQRPRIHATE